MRWPLDCRWEGHAGARSSKRARSLGAGLSGACANLYSRGAAALYLEKYPTASVEDVARAATQTATALNGVEGEGSGGGGGGGRVLNLPAMLARAPPSGGGGGGG